MSLVIKAENEGLCLRILDVEGEWKKIIPKLELELMQKPPLLLGEIVQKVSVLSLQFSSSMEKAGRAIGLL